jgi:hypothetical protein
VQVSVSLQCPANFNDLVKKVLPVLSANYFRSQRSDNFNDFFQLSLMISASFSLKKSANFKSLIDDFFQLILMISASFSLKKSANFKSLTDDFFQLILMISASFSLKKSANFKSLTVRIGAHKWTKPHLAF